MISSVSCRTRPCALMLTTVMRPTGGQIIQKMVRRALRLGTGPGTAAFSFEVCFAQPFAHPPACAPTSR